MACDIYLTRSTYATETYELGVTLAILFNLAEVKMAEGSYFAKFCWIDRELEPWEIECKSFIEKRMVTADTNARMTIEESILVLRETFTSLRNNLNPPSNNANANANAGMVSFGFYAPKNDLNTSSVDQLTSYDNQGVNNNAM